MLIPPTQRALLVFHACAFGFDSLCAGCCRSQSSIALLWNRQHLPTFWPGSLPSSTSLYSVDLEIFRYSANVSMVKTSSDSAAMSNSSDALGHLCPTTTKILILSIFSGFSQGENSSSWRSIGLPDRAATKNPPSLPTRRRREGGEVIGYENVATRLRL